VRAAGGVGDCTADIATIPGERKQQLIRWKGGSMSTTTNTTTTTTKRRVGECVTPSHQVADVLAGSGYLDAIAVLTRNDDVVEPSGPRHPARRSRIDSGQPTFPRWERSRQSWGVSDWQPGPWAASTVRIAAPACCIRRAKSTRQMTSVDEVQL
jgi:hypothetical protein